MYEVAAGLIVALLQLVDVDELILGKLGIELHHGSFHFGDRVIRIIDSLIQHCLLLLQVARGPPTGSGGGRGEASGARRRCVVDFLLVVDRFDLGEIVLLPSCGLKELDGPRQVIPATVVLKNDRCSVLNLSVRLEGAALVHGALGVLERDVREVLEHPVGLQARDVLVEK